MLRRLLDIASIICLIACDALMGMWVRSYWWTNNLHFKLSGAFLVDGASTTRSTPRSCSTGWSVNCGPSDTFHESAIAINAFAIELSPLPLAVPDGHRSFFVEVVTSR
jgi:hypothetical protein